MWQLSKLLTLCVSNCPMYACYHTHWSNIWLKASFLSSNTVNLAHLYCYIYILNRENKNNSLTVETFIKEIKKRSNFLDKNLILQYLFKIKRYIKVMLGADKTHNMLIIFRRKNSVFSVCCPAHLYYVWQIIYFDFCCKLLNFSVIIDGYYQGLN